MYVPLRVPLSTLRVLREDNVVPFKRATTLIYGEIERTPCYASTGAANPRTRDNIFARDIIIARILLPLAPTRSRDLLPVFTILNSSSATS